MLLEEFISSKLEGALEEITSSGWTETSPDSAGTFFSNDCPEALDQALVVFGGIELYSGLDAELLLVNKLELETTTYTSTGVKPPWVTEQQTAPAKATLE